MLDTAFIMLVSILLVILPAVLVTTVATNASSVHERKCRECGETKPLDLFQTVKRSLICRACNNRKSAAARARRAAATPLATARKCSGCAITKGASEFTSNKCQPGGLCQYCKSCIGKSTFSQAQKCKAELAVNQSATCTVCNKLKPAEQMCAYKRKCHECSNKYNREYRTVRYATDEHFRLSVLLRERVNKALKGNNKSQHSMDLVECTIAEFRQHIQQQFTPGMTWGNQGSWHLDHIRPCAAWDLTKPSEQAGCFHYTNYQPLWAKDNLSKGAKLDWLPSAEPSYTMLNDQPTSTNDIAGINHTVQSYTAAEVFDNKENSSSTEARKPCGFCKACKPCLASDIKRQNGKRPLQCQRPQAIGPASKTAKFSVAEAM